METARNKRMEIGQHFAGKIFIDALKNVNEEIIIGDDGWGEFKVNAGSVSLWLLK